VTVRDRTWIETTTPAALFAYGQGCAGSAGVPSFCAGGHAGLGRELELVVAQARANTAAVLCADVAVAATPLGNGCTLLIQNPSVLQVAPTSAAGHAAFGQRIPVAAGLRGVSVHFQAAIVDPAGALSSTLALTPGVTVQIGD
jgi:hypothetical protein